MRTARSRPTPLTVTPHSRRPGWVHRRGTPEPARAQGWTPRHWRASGNCWRRPPTPTPCDALALGSRRTPGTSICTSWSSILPGAGAASMRIGDGLVLLVLQGQETLDQLKAASSSRSLSSPRAAVPRWASWPPRSAAASGGRPVPPTRRRRPSSWPGRHRHAVCADPAHVPGSVHAANALQLLLHRRRRSRGHQQRRAVLQQNSSGVQLALGDLIGTDEYFAQASNE